MAVWYAGSFTVHVQNEERVPVRGLVTPGGLGIHKYVGIESYAVTHLATGKRVHKPLSTLSDAVDFANRILPLADWTLEDPSQGLQGNVVEAWERARAEDR